MRTEKPRPQYQRASPSRKGDICETAVKLSAWERGAEVFTNDGCTGPADMVIFWNNRFVGVDVKAVTVLEDGKLKRKKHPKTDLPVYVVEVIPSEQGYKAKWPVDQNGRLTCPQGFEELFA